MATVTSSLVVDATWMVQWKASTKYSKMCVSYRYLLYMPASGLGPEGTPNPPCGGRHPHVCYVYIRRFPCSAVQSREFKSAVARICASPSIAKSSCTILFKSVHSEFLASPFNSVQGGLHILSTRLHVGGAPNCASPCTSVQAQSSCCIFSKSSLRRQSGALLVVWRGVALP